MSPSQRRSTAEVRGMGWSGDACIVGIAERPAERKFHGTPTLTIEQWAGLAADALADAGIDPAAVDGLVCAGDVAEASLFLPATIAEYCGWPVNFAERVDLGGASAVGHGLAGRSRDRAGHLRGGGVRDGRATPPTVAGDRAARTRGRCSALRAWSGVRRRPSSTCPTATWRRTAATRCTRSATTSCTAGTSEARAKIASDQRVSACANPAAAFYGQPITVDDVLASRVIATPLHLLEIVMPCSGGAAFVVTTQGAGARLRPSGGQRRRLRRAAHAQDADVRSRDAPHAGA